MTTWQCAGCFIVSFSSLFICMDTTLLLWFTRSALSALFNDQTMTIMICNHTVCWGHFSTWPLSNRSVVIYVILHLEQLFEIYGWLFFYAQSPAARNCQKRDEKNLTAFRFSPFNDAGMTSKALMLSERLGLLCEEYPVRSRDHVTDTIYYTWMKCCDCEALIIFWDDDFETCWCINNPSSQLNTNDN